MIPMIYAKYDLASRLLAHDVASVLDVGCRDGALKTHLRAGIAYAGIDLHDGESVTKVCNVDQGIPFGDRSYDAVMALDVLEHTENIWFVFDELVRVARRQIVVVLPNEYHWSARLRYLFGQEMNKHVLPPQPVLDRHRWLVSYDRANAFCRYFARKHGLSIAEQVLFGGRRTLLVDVVLDRFSRNLAAWATMFAFERPGA